MCAWPQVRRRRLLARLALLLVTGLLTLALLEGSLRLTFAGGPPSWLHGPPNLEVTLATDAALMPGVSGEATTRLDDLGLRADGDHAQASIQVLCLGGSTSECAALDQDEAWPELFRQQLGEGAWVGTAARSGLTSRAHRLQLEAWLERLPELDRVLCLVGVNDLALALEQGQAHDPRGLEDGAIRAAVSARAFFARPLEPAWWPPRRTVTWSLIDRARRTRWAKASAARDLPERYSSWRGLRAAAAPHRDVLPDLSAALEEYRRNLTAMARRLPHRLVLCTQPVLWGEDAQHEALLWFGWVGRAPSLGAPDGYYGTAALARGMARYNQVLREVCAAEGVTLVDLARDMGGDGRWFYDDCHFNEAGAREVAARLHAALR